MPTPERPTHRHIPSGALIFPGDELAEDLALLTDADWAAEAQPRLLAQIDADCGRFRSRFITTTPGQEMTYLEKERQARDWAAAADPQDADYPMIAGEAAARGITLAAQVALVIAQADAWRLLGAAIEAARMGAKAAVIAATTEADKIAAAQVDWEGLLG